ncbi:MAG: hypothetical protein U0165_12200 [Polyangiaceae bacterium]
MFTDRLASKLELTLGSSTFSIESRDIERIELHMRAWGFSGEVVFWVVCTTSPDEDTVFAEFVKPDVAKAALTLARAFDEPDEEAEALVVHGIISDKRIQEKAVDDVAGAPVLMRRYAFHFEDTAHAHWRHHRPTALYVDSTLQTLIDDHVPTGVTLEHAWTASSTQYQVLSLGLGVEDTPAHFGDFIAWLTDRQHIGLFYDYVNDKYKLTTTKPTVSEPPKLEVDDVESIEVLFPKVRRDKVVVLNAYTDASEKKKEGTNANEVTGLRSDFLVRTSIASQVTSRSTLEGSRASQQMPGVKFTLMRFPVDVLAPGVGIGLVDDFSSNLWAQNKSFRIVAIDMVATLEGEQVGVDAETGGTYSMSYEIEAEQASDPVFRRPEYQTPVWPFKVEGKTLSETGADDEETYQIYQDSTTSLDQYKVKIPLFDDKKVVVLFEPITLSGHFYFPAYKDERVLIALHFDHANLVGFLDWRPGGRLPLESQGNHILFGKKAASQTSLQHIYQDAKPVLAIKRTDDKDEQTIRIFDGTIIMTTKENP